MLKKPVRSGKLKIQILLHHIVKSDELFKNKNCSNCSKANASKHLKRIIQH